MDDEHIEKFLGLKRKNTPPEGQNGTEAQGGQQDQPANGGQSFKDKAKDTMKGMYDRFTNAESGVVDKVKSQVKAGAEKMAAPEKKVESEKSVESKGQPEKGAAPPEPAAPEPTAEPPAPEPTASPAPEESVSAASGEQPAEDTSGGVTPKEDAPEEAPKEEEGTPTPKGDGTETEGNEEPAQPKAPSQREIYENNVLASIGLVGGALQSADRMFGTLKNIVGNILTGDPMKMGKQIGDSIMEAGIALEPIKDSLGKAFGIDVKNGKIDEDAVGTLQGAQYIKQKEALENFYKDTDEWLAQSLGPGANQKNLVQYLDNAGLDEMRHLSDEFNSRVEAKKDELYSKAVDGKLSKVDQALLDSYTKIGDALKTAAYNKSREAYLDAAKHTTAATQANEEMRWRKDQFQMSIDKLRDEVNARGFRNSRKKRLFNAIEGKLRQSMGSGKQYLVKDKKGNWKVDERKLDYNDWTRIRSDLESDLAKGKLNLSERKLLADVRNKINVMNYERAEDRDSWKLAMSGYATATSPLDIYEAYRKYKGQHGKGKTDPRGFPDYINERARISRSAGFIIDNVKSTLGNKIDPNDDYTWFAYLSHVPDKSDPNYDNYVKGLMAQNTQVGVSLKNHLSKFNRDNDDMTLTKEYRDMRKAAEKVLDGRTLRMSDPVNGYVSGVPPGSNEEAFVEAYNRFIEKKNENMEKAMRAANPKVKDETIERLKKPLMIPGTENDPAKIFGPTLPNTPPKSKPRMKRTKGKGAAALNGVTRVTSATKSFRLDAEGLTYGELFPIVKAKLGMDDEGTDDFIQNNVDNLGSDAADAFGFPKGEQGYTPNYDYGQMFDTDEKGVTRPNLGAMGFRPPKTSPKTGTNIPSDKDYLKPIIGRSKSKKEIDRKLRNWAKTVLADKNRSLEQKDYEMGILNRVYNPYGLEGKFLEDSNVLRAVGDYADVINELHKRRRDAKKREPFEPQITRYLGQYGLDDSYGDAMYKVLSGNVDLAPERFSDNYTRFRGLMDRYKGDKDTSDRLNAIWRNNLADAIRYNIVDADGNLLGKTISGLKHRMKNRKDRKAYDLEKDEEDMVTDRINAALNGRLDAIRSGEYVPKDVAGGKKFMNTILNELGTFAGDTANDIWYRELDTSERHRLKNKKKDAIDRALGDVKPIKVKPKPKFAEYFSDPLKNATPWVVNEFGLDSPGRGGTFDVENTYTVRQAFPAMEQFVGILEDDPKNGKNEVLGELNGVTDDNLRKFQQWLSVIDRRITSYNKFYASPGSAKYLENYKTYAPHEREANGLYYNPKESKQFKTLYGLMKPVQAVKRLVDAEIRRRQEAQEEAEEAQEGVTGVTGA